MLERLVWSWDIHVRHEALTRSNRHPNRLARWTFRLGVAVCVLIVAATVVSFWRSFTICVPGWLVTVNFGSAYVFADLIAPAGGWSAWSTGPVSQDFHLWTAKWQFTGLTIRSYPAWMFLLAALIPTMLAWRRLRRPLPGHCRKCGYNLTGNVTGKCSECGTEIDLK